MKGRVDMSEVKNPEGSDHQKTWKPEQALQLWNHFAGVGAADKNTMVTVASWLLGLSAAIIGYIVTQRVNANSPGVLTEPEKVIFYALLGIVISLVAGYVAILYGGYSNRNWAAADYIAEEQQWYSLLPTHRQKPVAGQPSFLAAVAKRRARPHDPTLELAPIFTLFVVLAACAAAAHLGFLIWSAVLILKRS
jgi:hypothetical protein